MTYDTGTNTNPNLTKKSKINWARVGVNLHLCPQIARPLSIYAQNRTKLGDTLGVAERIPLGMRVVN